jgi:hypothetical protein
MRVEITDLLAIESEGRDIVHAAERRARSRGANEIEPSVAFGNPAEVILE